MRVFFIQRSKSRLRTTHYGDNDCPETSCVVSNCITTRPERCKLWQNLLRAVIYRFRLPYCTVKLQSIISPSEVTISETVESGALFSVVE